MHHKLIVLVLISCISFSTQSVDDNEVEVEDVNPFKEAASAMFQNNGQMDLSGILGNLLQSGGAKQLGDMLLGAITKNNDITSQIMQGLGSILDQKEGGKGGLDPAVLGNVMNMLGSVGKLNNPKKEKSPSKSSDIDLSGLFASFSSLLNNQGGGDMIKLLDYAPMLLSTINSFIGPEAQGRAEQHQNHAWLMPPVLEKLHLMFDHFINSELGRAFIERLGAEKYAKMFMDENGNFQYEKFIELLENQSFRRHWIKMLTTKISEFLVYLADPKTHKNILQTGQFFLNSFLKGQGFPKQALFDPDRPTESITSFINHVSKKYFGVKYNAKQYVKPIVDYFKEITAMANKQGYIGKQLDTSLLSNKLTDTINLDIIEPILRVNRAFRFARKVHECDKYVICLVNQKEAENLDGLPGVKIFLTKSMSFVGSWLLTGVTGKSFWEYYGLVMDASNCQDKYLDACHDFHLQELKATTEYVHSEL